MKKTLISLLLCAASLAWSQTLINGSRVISGTVNYCADAGTTDAYACSLSPAITAYTTGGRYSFKANTANTGAAPPTYLTMEVASSPFSASVAAPVFAVLALNEYLPPVV